MPQVDVGLMFTAVNNAAKPIRETADGVKQIGENAQATANRLKAIQVVIAGIAIEKIRQMSELFLKAASATQSLDLHLAAFAGGVGPASQIWNKLNSEFGATPFKVDAISASWIKLQAVTNNSAQSTKIIEAVVNAVAAMPDGSDAKINDITVALQRMLATGTVEGRQFKSIITDAGLTVGDLAKAAGRSTESFNRSLQDGFLKSSDMINYFIKASEDKFGDFAVKLGSTIGGALNKIENDVQAGLSHLGERTDINDRLTQVFKNIDAAVTSFIDHISQGEIDHLFDVFADLEPIVRAALNDVKNLALVFLSLADATAVILDHMPASSTEYGLIGYVLWGAKGAIIGTLIGAVDWAWRGVVADIVQGLSYIGVVSDATYKEFRKWADHSTLEDIARIVNAESSGASNNGGSVFAKNAAMSAKIKQDLAAIMNTKPNTVGVGGDPLAFTKALEASARLADEIETSFNQIVDNVNALNEATSGDELGANIEAINKKTDGWLATIEAALKKIQTVEPDAKTQDLINQEAALKAEIDEVNKARDAAIEREKRLFDIKTQGFILDQRIARFNLADQIVKLQQQANTSASFNALGGTAGGSLKLEEMQREFDLRTQLLQIEKAQNDLDEQIAELGTDPRNAAKIDALERTKDLYKQLQEATESALKNLSVEGLAAKQMWTDIGNTLHNDVADGIKGLISGTMTLGQVATKVWSDITDSVIQYLLKLAEAQVMQSVLGAGSGGGASTVSTIASLATVLAAANGATFKGQITPFANGGITTGPTLFGLMGEAGTEAVMPLTRIGGKLGVHASGGGNHYHITVNAIDTQTGMEFLSKHIEAIDGQLLQRRSLHRNARANL